MSQDHISNVLAERYASPAMRAIWSGEGKVRLERDYWIAVLKAQRDLGIPVPDGVIESYERVKDQINLASIMQRERITRHDVKARIEEFCELAGHEHLHKGMTSRDLTENVEQLQVYRALQLVETKSVAALVRFAKRAQQLRDVPFTARTHNVAAQATTLGKRFATVAVPEAARPYFRDIADHTAGELIGWSPKLRAASRSRRGSCGCRSTSWRSSTRSAAPGARSSASSAATRSRRRSPQSSAWTSTGSST